VAPRGLRFRGPRLSDRLPQNGTGIRKARI
jgi:hypothetical protein